MVDHDVRCRYLQEPPTLRDPRDCDCGAYGYPLATVRAQRAASQNNPRSTPSSGQATGRAGTGRSRKSPCTGAAVYAEVARILCDIQLEYPSEHDSELLCDLMTDFGDWFEADNPRFDRKKFEEACAG